MLQKEILSVTLNPDVRAAEAWQHGSLEKGRRRGVRDMFAQRGASNAPKRGYLAPRLTQGLGWEKQRDSILRVHSRGGVVYKLSGRRESVCRRNLGNGMKRTFSA